MSAHTIVRAREEADKILLQIYRGNFRQTQSKKLWKNRGRTKYVRYVLTGSCRMVAVLREGEVLYNWFGTHEAYNSLLPQLRRRRF